MIQVFGKPLSPDNEIGENKTKCVIYIDLRFFKISQSKIKMSQFSFDLFWFSNHMIIQRFLSSLNNLLRTEQNRKPIKYSHTICHPPNMKVKYLHNTY